MNPYQGKPYLFKIKTFWIGLFFWLLAGVTQVQSQHQRRTIEPFDWQYRQHPATQRHTSWVMRNVHWHRGLRACQRLVDPPLQITTSLILEPNLGCAWLEPANPFASVPSPATCYIATPIELTHSILGHLIDFCMRLP